jgi:hypothetical protein
VKPSEIIGKKNSGNFLLNELPVRVKHKWGCNHRYRLKPIDWRVNPYRMVPAFATTNVFRLKAEGQ